MKGGALPFPHPLRCIDEQRQGFSGRRHLLGILVGIHPPRELDPPHFHTQRPQPLRIPRCCPLSSLVRIIGQLHPANPSQRLRKLVGKAFRPVKRRDVRDPVGTERQSIHHRLAQNDFIRLKRRPVEQPPMRPRRVKVVDRPFADPSSVKTHNPARLLFMRIAAEERHNNAAVKMLMPALPPHA